MALNIINQVLRDNPEDCNAAEMKGEVLYHIGSFEQAIVQVASIDERQEQLFEQGSPVLLGWKRADDIRLDVSVPLPGPCVLQQVAFER